MATPAMRPRPTGMIRLGRSGSDGSGCRRALRTLGLWGRGGAVSGAVWTPPGARGGDERATVFADETGTRVDTTPVRSSSNVQPTSPPVSGSSVALAWGETASSAHSIRPGPLDVEARSRQACLRTDAWGRAVGSKASDARRTSSKDAGRSWTRDSARSTLLACSSSEAPAHPKRERRMDSISTTPRVMSDSGSFAVETGCHVRQGRAAGRRSTDRSSTSDRAMPKSRKLTSPWGVNRCCQA